MTSTARLSGSSHRSRGVSSGIAWAAAAVGLAAAAFVRASWQARRRTSELRSRLEAARIRIPVPTCTVDELANLPAPVQRYFLVPFAASRGTPEGARGELIRFLAEAAWYPTALLPSQGVRWQAVDAVSANATLSDGDTEVTLLFTFDSAGLIESARAEARGAAIGKTVVMMPWEGRWANYRARGGMLVPTEGEAAWLTPHGRKAYWRGSVTDFAYEFEPPALPADGRL